MLSHYWATPSNCGKFSICHNYRPGVERSAQWHQGETRGYGKNVVNRDNPQPSPKVSQKTMDAVQRLDGGGRVQKYLHKIKSVPTEMWSNRGIVKACHGFYKESCWVLDSTRMEQTLAYSN